jgi:hypothetical protein
MESRARVPDIGWLLGKDEVGDMGLGDMRLGDKTLGWLIGLITSAGGVAIDAYENILIEFCKLCITSFYIPSIL